MPKLVTGSAIKFVLAAARVKVCLKKKLSFKLRAHNKPPERSHKRGGRDDRGREEGRHHSSPRGNHKGGADRIWGGTGNTPK